MRELICITCPKGCYLKVDEENDYKVTGNGCPRGAPVQSGYHAGEDIVSGHHRGTKVLSVGPQSGYDQEDRHACKEENTGAVVILFIFEEKVDDHCRYIGKP